MSERNRFLKESDTGLDQAGRGSEAKKKALPSKQATQFKSISFFGGDIQSRNERPSISDGWKRSPFSQLMLQRTNQNDT